MIKKYKLFTQFLLEEHPLLWHSKAIQMILIGIAANLISYFFGYNLMHLEFLKSNSIESLFFDTLYVLYFFVFCLILIVVWGLTFHKNNAAKKFYPIDDLYFFKLFSLVFCFTSVILMSYFSFTYGAKSKVKNCTSIKQIVSEANTLNLAFAFLGSAEEYNYSGRCYPQEYQNLNYQYAVWDTIKIKEQDSIDKLKIIENHNSAVHYDNSSSEVDEAVLAADDAVAMTEATYSNSILPDAYRMVNGKLDEIKLYRYRQYGGEISYIPFDTILMYYSHILEDSCKNSKTIIDSFTHIRKFSDFGLNKLYNYNRTFINGDYGQKEVFDILSYDTFLSPITYRWVKNYRRDSIVNILYQANAIFKKYQIEHYISPDDIYNRWKSNKFEADGIILHSSKYEAVQASENSKSKEKLFYADSQMLSTLFTNIQDVYLNNNFKHEIFILICLALFVSLSIVFLEFANLKLFLISIPIGGVIATIFILIRVFVEPIFNDVNFDFYLSLVYSAFIIGVTWYCMRSYTLPKKVLSIFYYILYCNIPMIITSIYGLLHQLSKYEYIKCGIKEMDHHFTLNTNAILAISVFAYFLFMLTIKKYLAKEE